VLELIERLRRERGLTGVLVTHAAEIAVHADRVVRMLDGRAEPAPAAAAPVGVATVGR
jgi:ABC-type lipoprotein export system ATPase subunit